MPYTFRIFIGLALLLTLGFAQDDWFAKSKARGKALYEEFCITCHLGQGEGLVDVFPPLAQSDYLLQKPNLALRAIKYGQRGPVKVNGRTYNGVMAAPGLNDQEVADVMNYISHSFGNQSKLRYRAEDVARIKP
ncbi:MAG: c-type cytochrome [Microscillaceae bacterium]|nr:c-type cytochrome [Microscillaceae bacterium]